ncbi:MAG: benzaldehyde dehydrogenase [Acidobacteriaceae bacterium]|nr:benzaldehyde dehydrogenase [Acidobacteriaceae bacterium]
MSLSAVSVAAEPWTGRIFSNGWQAVDRELSVLEPATGQLLTSVGAATAEHASKAAHGAAERQKHWAVVPPRQKAEILRRAAAIFERDAERMAQFIVRETGGILPKAQHEVREAAMILHMASNLSLQPHGQVLPSQPNRISLARRVPLGVVGVISPFNFPLILSMRAVAPALALGNAVVLKPDPRTPVTGGLFIAQVFEEAGLPEGILHVLPGGSEVGEALCTHDKIAMVAFTGSTAAGRKVGEICGRHLKKVSLELGGKNALIITEDTDLDLAVTNTAWGAYLHQGQICMASGRVLVQRQVAAEFTAKLAAKARSLPVGDPAHEQVAIGPIISKGQLDRVHSIVTDSVAEGAILEAGGAHRDLFYAPTVLSSVDASMRAWKEEIFGPVACITAFDNDQQAVEMANDTEYGLSSAVICRSLSRANAIASQLHTGLVHINDQTVNDEVINPFGGFGASGNGTSVGGPADIDQFTQWQWVTIKDAPPQYPF